MKKFLALGVVAVLLAGCVTSPVANANNVTRIETEVGTYIVGQDPEDTSKWGATFDNTFTLSYPDPIVTRATGSKAIEAASGCTVIPESIVILQRGVSQIWANVRCK